MSEYKDKAYQFLRTAKQNIEELAIKEMVKIDGRTLKEWRAYLRVEIKQDASFQDCVKYDIELLSQMNTIAYYLSAAELEERTADMMYKTRFNEEFKKVCVEQRDPKTKKLPAEKTLANLTQEKLLDEEWARELAAMKVGFWKNMRNAHDSKRKLIETMTLNLSSDAKFNSSGVT